MVGNSNSTMYHGALKHCMTECQPHLATLFRNGMQLTERSLAAGAAVELKGCAVWLLFLSVLCLQNLGFWGPRIGDFHRLPALFLKNQSGRGRKRCTGTYISWRRPQIHLLILQARLGISQIGKY